MIMWAIGSSGVTTPQTPRLSTIVPRIISGMAILCSRPLKFSQRPMISVIMIAISASMMCRWPMIEYSMVVFSG